MYSKKTYFAIIIFDFLIYDDDINYVVKINCLGSLKLDHFFM